MRPLVFDYIPIIEKGLKKISDELLITKYNYRHTYNEKVRNLVEREVKERGLLNNIDNAL